MAKIHLNDFHYEINETPRPMKGRTYCGSGNGKGETLTLAQFNEMRKTKEIKNMCSRCLSRSEKTGIGVMNTGMIEYHPL